MKTAAKGSNGHLGRLLVGFGLVALLLGALLWEWAGPGSAACLATATARAGAVQALRRSHAPGRQSCHPPGSFTRRQQCPPPLAEMGSLADRPDDGGMSNTNDQASAPPPDFHTEGQIVGATETTLFRLRPIAEPAGTIGPSGVPAGTWYRLDVEARPESCQRMVERFCRAPQLALRLPGSGQTWQLRLTPALARQLAAEGVSLKSIHDAARRSRRERGGDETLQLSVLVS